MPNSILSPEQASELLIRWQQLAEEYQLAIHPWQHTGHRNKRLEGRFFCDATVAPTRSAHFIIIARTTSIEATLRLAIVRLDSLGDRSPEDIRVSPKYYPPEE